MYPIVVAYYPHDYGMVFQLYVGYFVRYIVSPILLYWLFRSIARCINPFMSAKSAFLFFSFIQYRVFLKCGRYSKIKSFWNILELKQMIL